MSSTRCWKVFASWGQRSLYPCASLKELSRVALCVCVEIPPRVWSFMHRRGLVGITCWKAGSLCSNHTFCGGSLATEQVMCQQSFVCSWKHFKLHKLPDCSSQKCTRDYMQHRCHTYLECAQGNWVCFHTHFWVVSREREQKGQRVRDLMADKSRCEMRLVH